MDRKTTLACAMVLAGAAGTSYAQGYAFHQYIVPSTDVTSFDAINSAGTVLGMSGIFGPVGSLPRYTGFTYTEGVLTQFAVPAARGTYPYGMNNHGTIVGDFSLDAGGQGSFIYNNGSFALFSTPENTARSFSGINDANVIVGFAGANPPPGSLPSYTGFTFDGTTYSSFSVPGARATYPSAINAQGVVVGSFSLPDDTGGAFVYDGSSFALFTVPDADTTSFTGINNSGAIVGLYGKFGPPGTLPTYIGFTFDGSTYSTFSFPGARATYPDGIGDDGAIVGGFSMPDGSSAAFIATPVPEPRSTALLALGLALLIGLRGVGQSKAVIGLHRPPSQRSRLHLPSA